jgi:hypothetical protein
MYLFRAVASYSWEEGTMLREWELHDGEGIGYFSAGEYRLKSGQNQGSATGRACSRMMLSQAGV